MSILIGLQESVFYPDQKLTPVCVSGDAHVAELLQKAQKAPSLIYGNERLIQLLNEELDRTKYDVLDPYTVRNVVANILFPVDASTQSVMAKVVGSWWDEKQEHTAVVTFDDVTLVALSYLLHSSSDQKHRMRACPS